MLIDTHAHLWFDDFADDLDAVIGRAKVAGVEKMIVPGTDIESSKKAIELARRYPGVIFASVGVHPEEVVNSNLQVSPGLANETRLNISAFSRDLVSRRDLIKAIGEIGTDASTEELKNCMETQKNLLKEQCEMAIEYDLPVIIHTRNSLTEALQVLDDLKEMPKGQFHCFSHDEIGLEQVLSRGFYVSFCGNITWSKRIAKLVSLVPDNRLLLETDSPLMVPRDTPPFALASSGGVKNEPANVRYLAEKIAELRRQSFEEIAKMTTENAIGLFRL